jgi:hypothetical protein
MDVCSVRVSQVRPTFLIVRPAFSMQVVGTSAMLGYDVIKPGRWYQFRVAAVNSIGSQGWSRPSSPFTSSASELCVFFYYFVRLNIRGRDKISSTLQGIQKKNQKIKRLHRVQ